MSDLRSPELNTLRGMLIRRHMNPSMKKPKRVKLTRTGKKMSDRLSTILKSVLSESSLSADESSMSSWDC
nr:ORF3 [Torque teno felis virus]QYD02274.1 ORF3 [Torque teno felis virus]